MKASSSETDQKTKEKKKETILWKEQMLRIPRLVLFRMVNENFSFFSFHTLALSAKKKRKPVEGRTPCGTLQSLFFIPLTWDVEGPVSKCRKNARAHTALMWSLLKYSQCWCAHERCENTRSSSEDRSKLRKQTFWREAQEMCPAYCRTG